MSNENSPNQTPEQARAQQAQERETHLKSLRHQRAVEEIFAQSPIKFRVSPEEVLRTMGTVRFDGDGNPVVEGTPLAEMLERVSKVNPAMVAGSPFEAHNPESLIKAKSDLKSNKEKSDYVGRFGLAAFERLPLNPVAELDESTLTVASFSKLPTHEKVKLINRHGWDFPAKLKQAEAEQTRLDRLVGVPQGKKKP